MVRRELLNAQIEKFGEHGYLKVRLVEGAGSDKIGSMCKELLSSRFSAVHVGDFGEAWNEHYVPFPGEIANLLASEEAHAWAQDVTRESLQRRAAVWGNVYRPGEHITWHRDARGQVQLLVNLRQPSPDCGGIFQVRRGGKTLAIGLAPGDGILFRATKIEHRITPLKATPGTPEPIRITAVARYFSSTQS